MMTPTEEIEYLCDRVLSLLEENALLRERCRSHDEVNRGWVRYKYRVADREHQWAEELADALGLRDRFGRVPHMDQLIHEVKQLRS